jgi:HAAS
MSTLETDRLVDEYLRRLDRAAATLPQTQRIELVTEIREHIAAALHEETRNEVDVRNVLERLGPPEEIVDAARPTAPADARPAGRLEVAALILLVVPLVGWLFGVVLVLVSRAWSAREKAVGVLLALPPALVPAMLMTAGTESGTIANEPIPVGPGEAPPGGFPDLGEGDDVGLGLVEVAALALTFLAGAPSALYLGWRLRRGRDRR